MDTQSLLVERRVTAVLLILCGIVVVVAVILYMGRATWKWPAGEAPSYLLWERVFVVVALLINTMGFVLLAGMLREAGDKILAPLALVIYLLGTAVLIIAETTFIHTRAWVYPQIVFFVVVAFLAQAAFGVALLRTGLVAGWAAWATIIWNLFWLVALPIASPRDIYYPVLHYVAPLIIGIALLVGE